jgi:hypothetical protein
MEAGRFSLLDPHPLQAWPAEARPRQGLIGRAGPTRSRWNVEHSTKRMFDSRGRLGEVWLGHVWASLLERR